ncbi:MAG: pentapeptide repeat-containing protein [Cyanobacteria bacterium MAG CAR3_bin_5]|nr:pentapeptide repeat-containing protein [Cyanobacteria bacterium MAG CAR3_bin_5]
MDLCKVWQVLIGLGWLALIAAFPITSWPLISDQITNHKSEDLQKWGWYLLGAGIAPLTLLLTHDRTRSLRTQTGVLKSQTDVDTFTKSIKLLGDEQAAVRQGGIYSLGRIAKDNSNLHPTIMKIMTSYLREKTYENFNEQLKKESSGNKDKLIEKLRLAQESAPSDIEAAIDVIRERRIENDKLLKDSKKSFRFDLSSSYFFNANFCSIDKFSDVNFSDTTIQGCRFSKTDLSGSPFISSNLQESLFVDSVLKECEFKKADLRKCDFEGCDLSGSEFESCDLTGAENLTQEQIDSAKVDQYTKLPEGISYPKNSK